MIKRGFLVSAIASLVCFQSHADLCEMRELELYESIVEARASGAKGVYRYSTVYFSENGGPGPSGTHMKGGHPGKQ